jgi:single-strand DNA-binding protein
MNALRNKVQLIGRVGQDPEIANLEAGKKRAKFSIATHENYTNAKGEKVENTDWHNVVAWGKTAEIIEKFVTKGKEIAIEGKLTTHTWDDKEGIKHYMTEVICNELLMLGGK